MEVTRGPVAGWTRPIRRELADRLEDLLGPRLPVRPACAGRSPTWDLDVFGETPDQRDTRHQLAVALCRGCDALPDCTALLPNLPADCTGVWAGVVLDGRRRR